MRALCRAGPPTHAPGSTCFVSKPREARESGAAGGAYQPDSLRVPRPAIPGVRQATTNSPHVLLPRSSTSPSMPGACSGTAGQTHRLPVPFASSNSR